MSKFTVHLRNILCILMFLTFITSIVLYNREEILKSILYMLETILYLIAIGIISVIETIKEK